MEVFKLIFKVFKYKLEGLSMKEEKDYGLGQNFTQVWLVKFRQFDHFDLVKNGGII